MTADENRRSASGRFTLIDAFRGIAATSVVVFHVYKQNLLVHARAPLIEPLNTLFVNGYLGVYIFFVLSGFVIAHSVRDAKLTPGYIGRFALRRSLRLDPPYWVAIAAMIMITAVANRSIQDHHAEQPSVAAVAAHLVYVQQFFGFPQILGVFWTLCLEIQFYLVLVILLYVTQRLTPSRLWTFLGPLWLVSLMIGSGLIEIDRAVFLWAWPFFFLGVVTAWHFEKRISSVAWLVIVIGSCALAFEDIARIAVAAVTATILWLAGRARYQNGSTRLQSMTLGRPMQYLGRISYSLYLTHLLVGSKVARFGIRLLGSKEELGAVEMIALLVGCTVLSIAVAHVMYICVEQPAQRFSRRIALRAFP